MKQPGAYCEVKCGCGTVDKNHTCTRIVRNTLKLRVVSFRLIGASEDDWHTAHVHLHCVRRIQAKRFFHALPPMDLHVYETAIALND